VGQRSSDVVLGSLRPVGRTPRLSDRVAELMLSAILAQGLKPGSKLPSERELGAQFGVSRTVVREATRALVAKGVLDVRPGAGLTVATADPASVAESMNLYLRNGSIPYENVHEVRTMIEIQVAGLAAERGTPGQVETLRLLHTRLCDLTEGTDLETLAVADVEFHRHLARMTGNGLHLLMLDSIGDVLLEIRRETVANRDDSLAAILAHGRILERVADRAPAGAREAMRIHLEQAFSEWDRLARPVGALRLPVI